MSFILLGEEREHDRLGGSDWKVRLCMWEFVKGVKVERCGHESLFSDDFWKTTDSYKKEERVLVLQGSPPPLVLKNKSYWWEVCTPTRPLNG